MKIHKPWRNDSIGCINDTISLRLDFADLRNAIAGDPDVLTHGLVTSAVDYKATANDQVKVHAVTLGGMPMPRHGESIFLAIPRRDF
jgi:hypothetical protein